MSFLFPTVLHIIHTDSFFEVKDQLIEYAYKEKKKDSEGVSRSNIGGWHSNINYNESDNILAYVIGEFVKSYFVHNSIFKDNCEAYLTSLWININKKGDFNYNHVHPCSHLSGVMWIKCTQESGNIEFISPSIFSGAEERETYSESFKKKMNIHDSYALEPREGTILLFPADLQHKVLPNNSDEDRISASFNIRFK